MARRAQQGQGASRDLRLAGRAGVALVLLPLLRASVAVVGFNRTRAALDRARPRRAAPTLSSADGLAELQRAAPICRAVQAAAARLPAFLNANCLPQSLLAWAWLQRAGIDAELIFGVRRDDQTGLLAHAWVEVGGVAVSDRADVGLHYARFDRPLSSPRAPQ